MLKNLADESKKTKDTNIRLNTRIAADIMDADTVAIYTDRRLTIWKNNICIKSVPCGEFYDKYDNYKVACYSTKFIAVYSHLRENTFIYDTELNLLQTLKHKYHVISEKWSRCGKLAIGMSGIYVSMSAIN
jgi:hypothetical protein